ncbi:MAG: T9SS type A sorting domain-containing protein [Ignavibacteriaceae bacterium]|nr:T9SS type A sorting domain-containing protein [Ignavibacteriaceae bacterium]
MRCHLILLIFTVIIFYASPGYAQEELNGIEVVYQFYSDTTTGKTYKGFYTDSSFFPYDKRNKWQFRYVRVGGPPAHNVIYVNEFSSETRFGNADYRRYSVFGYRWDVWEWVRFDKQSNKIYTYKSPFDELSASFSAPHGSSQPLYNILTHSSNEHTITNTSYNFLGGLYASQKYYIPTITSTTIFSKGLGWVYYYDYYCCHGGVSTNEYELTQAMIYDSLGVAVFYNPSTRPEIIFSPPSVTDSLSMNLTISVKHPYNYINTAYWNPEEYNFIKNVEVKQYYKKGNDSIGAVSLFPPRTPYTEKYNFRLNLVDTLVSRGYDIYLQVIATDKSLIPMSRDWPGNAFHKITYSTQTGIGDDLTDKKREGIKIVNQPNPFDHSTKIVYTLTDAGYICIKIYDLLGREAAALVEEEKAAGEYEVTFKATGLSPGIYFCELRTGTERVIKKMMLLR